MGSTPLLLFFKKKNKKTEEGVGECQKWRTTHTTHTKID